MPASRLLPRARRRPPPWHDPPHDDLGNPVHDVLQYVSVVTSYRSYYEEAYILVHSKEIWPSYWNRARGGERVGPGLTQDPFFPGMLPERFFFVVDPHLTRQGGNPHVHQQQQRARSPRCSLRQPDTGRGGAVRDGQRDPEEPRSFTW